MTKRSNWWYIVPILFGFVGGIIAFFAIKGNDKDKALNMVFVGILITAIHVLTNFGVMLTVFSSF